MLSALAIVLGLTGLAIAAAALVEARTGGFVDGLADEFLPWVVLLQSSIMAGGAWVAVGGRAAVLGFRTVPRRWILAAVAGVAAILLYDVAAASIIDPDGVKDAQAGDAIADYLDDAPANDFLLLLVMAAGVAPLGEEMLFRGLIFAWLSRWTGWIPAALLTALLFALGHLAGGTLHGVASFGAGLVLAVLYRASGSLWPAILAHGLNNTIAIALLWLGAE